MLCTCRTDSITSEALSSPKHIIQGRLQNKPRLVKSSLLPPRSSNRVILQPVHGEEH